MPTNFTAVPRQARHPAAQQHRLHRHAARSPQRPAARQQPRVRRRRQPVPVHERHGERVLRAHRFAWQAASGQDSYRGRFELCRRSLRLRRRTPADRRAVQSGGRIRAAHRFPPQLRLSSASARVRRTQKRVRRYNFTAELRLRHERGRDAASRTELQSGRSPPNIRTATALTVHLHEPTTNSLPARLHDQRGDASPSCRPAATTIRTSGHGIRSASSGRCRASITASTARSTTGRRRRRAIAGRLAIMPQFALEPSVSLNWVRLPFANGDFAAPVISSRFIFTPNARTALTASFSTTAARTR